MAATSRVWTFFAVTVGLTCLCQIPGILSLRAGSQPTAAEMLLMAVGSCMPSLIAIAFCAAERGRPGVAALLSRRQYPRAGLYLCLLALLLPMAAHLLGSVLLLALGQYRAEHVLYLPPRPEQIAIAILAPLGEEYGWRGYALPRLQSEQSPISASLWIGVVWALWHVPTFFVPEARGTTPFELAMYCVAFLSCSLIYTWLFNAGRGSMLGPLLIHFGVHLDNVFRASASGDGAVPLTLTTAVYMFIALALVLQDRLGSKDAVSEPQPMAAGAPDPGPALGVTRHLR